MFSIRTIFQTLNEYQLFFKNVIWKKEETMFLWPWILVEIFAHLTNKKLVFWKYSPIIFFKKNNFIE